MVGVLLLLAAAAGTPAPAPLTVGRLHYDGGGDWYVNPSSLPNLLAAIRNRTTLQGADREALFVAPGKQGCMWLVPPSYYEGDFVRAVSSSFEGGLPDQFFHVCQRRALDKAGRILIDERSRELAELGDPAAADPVQVVVAGSGRYLQVWSKPDYDARALPPRQIAQNIPGSGNAFGGGARP